MTDAWIEEVEYPFEGDEGLQAPQIGNSVIIEQVHNDKGDFYG